MDKEQYKRVMERMQMPEDCEERIFAAVQTGTLPKQKKQLSTLKKSGIALAVAACVGAVTILPIAAEQNGNLLHAIFPFSDTDQVATDETVANAMSTGNVENFQVTGMEGLTITPMGVVNDAKSIYLMLHVVPDAGVDLTNTVFIESGPVLINGEICYTEENEDGPLDLSWTGLNPYSEEPLEDGSYNWVYELRCEKDVAVDSVDVTLGLSSFLKGAADDTQELGTISATLELGEALESRSFVWDEPIAVGDAAIASAELSCFSLEFDGNGDCKASFWPIPDMTDNEDCQCLLYLTDGSTVEMQKEVGSWYPEMDSQPFNMVYYFQNPVNPAEVVSIQLGDTIIPLT